MNFILLFPSFWQYYKMDPGNLEKYGGVDHLVYCFEVSVIKFYLEIDCSGIYSLFSILQIYMLYNSQESCLTIIFCLMIISVCLYSVVWVIYKSEVPYLILLVI